MLDDLESSSKVRKLRLKLLNVEVEKINKENFASLTWKHCPKLPHGAIWENDT